MDDIKISVECGYHRRGHPGALNGLLRVAGELIIPAVSAASVEFSIASDRVSTYSYTSRTAKIDTYETTIVQEWARYMSSHAAFSNYGVAWESKFRTGFQGRPPAVDIVIENSSSSAARRVALIEVKVSERELNEADPWSDATKLWELEVGLDHGQKAYVEAKRFVVNVVRGLDQTTTPAEFEKTTKCLADRSCCWIPRFVPVFSAVFPVFRPSKGPGGSEGSAMWDIYGVSGFELKAEGDT